ncbi:DUF2958 domain-containing protein [Candidatus Margulisiibacteriota bacterium]
MKLLTKELFEAFKKQGDTSAKEAKDIKVICKYFLCETYWSWYATDFDVDTGVFFGWVEGHFNELGSFSLEELERVKSPTGTFKVERDLYWNSKTTLEEVMR